VCENISSRAEKASFAGSPAFSVKKSAIESHRLLVEGYSEAALSKTTCRDWFRRFKNGDFDMKGKERAGRPNLVEDAELETFLDEDPCQTQKQLVESLGGVRSIIFMHLKAIGNDSKVRKLGMSWSRDLERSFFLRVNNCFNRKNGTAKTERFLASYCYW